jgi:hypothetical protein
VSMLQNGSHVILQACCEILWKCCAVLVLKTSEGNALLALPCRSAVHLLVKRKVLLCVSPSIIGFGRPAWACCQVLASGSKAAPL